MRGVEISTSVITVNNNHSDTCVRDEHSKGKQRCFCAALQKRAKCRRVHQHFLNNVYNLTGIQVKNFLEYFP